MTDTQDAATDDMPTRKSAWVIPTIVIGKLTAMRVLEFKEGRRCCVCPELSSSLRLLQSSLTESGHAVPELGFRARAIVENELNVHMAIVARRMLLTQSDPGALGTPEPVFGNLPPRLKAVQCIAEGLICIAIGVHESTRLISNHETAEVISTYSASLPMHFSTRIFPGSDLPLS